MNRNRMVDFIRDKIRNDLMYRINDSEFQERFQEFENFLGVSYSNSQVIDEYINDKRIVIVGSITGRNIQKLTEELKNSLGFEPKIEHIDYEKTKRVNYGNYEFSGTTDLIIENRDHEAKGTESLKKIKNREKNENPLFKDLLDYEDGLSGSLSKTTLFRYILEESAYVRDYNLLKTRLDFDD